MSKLPAPAGRFTAMVAAWALAAALLAVAPASGQSFDPFLEIKVEEALADGDGDRAVAMLEEAITGADDPRVEEDLLRRLAELHGEQGRAAEAAAAWQRLVAVIAAADGAASPRLIPVLEAAADAHEAAGRSEAAAEALDALLGILASAGLLDQAAPHVARLEAIAAAGDAEAAARAESALALHRERVETAEGRGFLVDPEGGFTIVKIYYATDRKRTGSTEPNEFYGGERGTLELGTATVSIPPRHLPGQIEKPSIWTFTFREDPEQHVVLSSVTPMPEAAVFAEMRQQLADADSDEAFVFVHGFNVPFFEAAQRTAQMAYDMNFSGLPILFSWPSRASVLSYIADTAVVNLSGRRLTLFLEDVVRRSGAKRIHLIAHSMGNRAMTDALELYALRHEGEPPAFDQVLFTAPDLDAGLFAEMMKTIRTTARRVTLYASNRDWALAVSRRLHGDEPRAGQGGETILHAEDVDSIDMSSIGEDMLAHSYYANNPSALTDILSLFWRDAPPEERCGMTEEEGAYGTYWAYDPEECDSDAMLSTLSILRRGSVASLAEARAFFRRFVLPINVDPEQRSRLESTLAKLFGD